MSPPAGAADEVESAAMKWDRPHCWAIAALERICLLPCEELADLKAKISAYKSRAK